MRTPDVVGSSWPVPGVAGIKDSALARRGYEATAIFWDRCVGSAREHNDNVNGSLAGFDA